jgi:single-strand DNA-binding protein
MGSAYTTISGNLGSDAEFKMVGQDGSMLLCTFSVATENWKPGGAETIWYNCAVFGKRAEGLAKLFDNGGLRKGSFVAGRGTASINTYTKNDGSFGASMQINLDNVDIAMPPRQDVNQGYQPQQQYQQPAPQQMSPQQQMNQAQQGFQVPPPQFVNYGQS